MIHKIYTTVKWCAIKNVETKINQSKLIIEKEKGKVTLAHLPF